MHRLITLIALFTSLGVMLSCSGMEEAAQVPEDEKDIGGTQQYPAWYGDQEVISDGNMVFAYATAVDTDSASSVSKAVAWAESEMKSEVSSRLENIRTEAMEATGGDSGLDDPQFLIALRKAEEDIDPLVETSNTEVRSIEGYDTYRSFAEIQVPKDKLIERIGERVDSYEKAWSTIKESKAFENF